MGQTSSSLINNKGINKEAGRRLLAAGRNGDTAEFDAVMRLPEEPLLLLYENYQGCNVVHFAATEGHFELLKQLVVHVKAHAATLAQELAARLQAEAEAKELSVSARLSQLRQPLLPWCSRSQALQLLDPARVLPTLLSWQNHKHVTPLMLAARGGHADCLALLLSEGADPLTVDKVSKRSCLHYAVIPGHVECVNVLLNEFRTVEQEPSAPPSAFSNPSASDAGSRRRHAVLLRSAMVWDGCSGACRFVDQRTSTGFSALHYCAYWGSSAVAYALLTAGADVLRRTGNNSSTTCCELVTCGDSTPLHLAAANGHRYVAAMLLQAQLQVMSRHAHLAAPEGSRLQAAWEGQPNWDPRAARNALGCTAMEVANMQLNSSDLVLLLDPTVPLSWMLQAGGLSGSVRFGVPRLADLAKAALDSHLSSCLDQLESAQQQARQQQAAAKQQQAAAKRQQAAIARSRSVASNLSALGDLRGGEAAAASASAPDATTAGRLASSASWHGSSLASMVAAVRRGRACWSSWAPDEGDAAAGSSKEQEAGSATGAGSDNWQGLPEQQEQQEPHASNSEPLVRATLRGWAGESAAASSDEAARCFSRPASSGLLLQSGSSGEQGGWSSMEDTSDAGSDTGEREEGEELEGDDDALCGICFDAASSVRLAGCHHELCVGCVRSLISASKQRAPACPFCRRGMSGFVAAETQPCS